MSDRKKKIKDVAEKLEEMRKRKPSVLVETVPNGYTMKVDNEDYLYFTASELMAGVFVHIGLEKLDCLDINHVEALMEAVLSWPSIKEAATIQANSMSDLRQTRKDLYIARRYNVELQNKMKDLENQSREIRSQLFIAQKRIEANNDLEKQLEDSINTQNKLNMRNVRLEKERYEQEHTIAAMKRELAKYVKRVDAKVSNRATDKGVNKKAGRSRKIADALVQEELNKQQQNIND